MRCFFLNFKGKFLKASTSLPAMAKHHIIKKPYGQLLLFPFELMRHFYLRLTFLLFHLLSCTELDLCFFANSRHKYLMNFTRSHKLSLTASFFKKEFRSSKRPTYKELTKTYIKYEIVKIKNFFCFSFI